MIATAFAHQPTTAIPQACGPGSATQGACRFFENDDLEAEAIREAHHQATFGRVRQHAIVLALQDTSTLNYTPLIPRPKAWDPSSRTAKKPSACSCTPRWRSRPAANPWACSTRRWTPVILKPSAPPNSAAPAPSRKRKVNKWLESLEACQQLAPLCPETLLVNVADREADLYELFAQALAPTADPPVHRLVRSRHNHQLAGQDRRLWDALAGQRADGRLQVRVGRRAEQPARLATLTIRFRPVTLAAPARKAEPPR